jgi:S1-C subfamily serine protease
MFCPTCGTQIPDDSSFCLKCGRSMSVAPTVPTVKKGARSAGRLLRLVLGLGGALAAVALGLAVYYLNESKAASGSAVGATTGSKPVSAQEPPPIKLSPGEIAAKYSDAVVILENYNDQGQASAQGSGFICSPDGTILTNYHVIRGASRMTARMHDQSIHDVEYVAGFDAQHDVAAVKIDGQGLPSVHVGSSSSIKAGDHVVALGAPLGLESTLSDGIISAVREAGAFRLFQTSAPISHGSSGGPMFDDYGNVIALVVSTIEMGENLNFAVPIDAGKTLLTENRQTSFAELLSMTAVRQPVITSTISVPPQVMSLNIAVPPQGGILVGSLSISGGFGNDLGLSVASDKGALMWNGGIVKNNGSLNLRLGGGRYTLVLNNKMGPFWVSPKTVSGTLELTYYR